MDDDTTRDVGIESRLARLLREGSYSGRFWLLAVTGVLFSVEAIGIHRVWPSTAVYLLTFGIWLMISAYMLLLRRLKPEYVRSLPWAYGVSTAAGIGYAAVAPQIFGDSASGLLFVAFIGCHLVPFVEAHIKLERLDGGVFAASGGAADFELDEVLRVSPRSDFQRVTRTGTRGVGIELTRMLRKGLYSGRFWLLAVTGFLFVEASFIILWVWPSTGPSMDVYLLIGMWLLLSALMLLFRRLKPEYVRSLPWAYGVSTAAVIGYAAVAPQISVDSASGLLFVAFIGYPLVPFVEAYIKLERLDGGVFAASGGAADFELDEVLRVSSRSDSQRVTRTGTRGVGMNDDATRDVGIELTRMLREGSYSGRFWLLAVTGVVFVGAAAIILWVWPSTAVYLFIFGMWLLLSALMLLFRRLNPEYVRSLPWAYGMSTVAGIGHAAVTTQIFSIAAGLLFVAFIGCPLVPFVEAYIKLERLDAASGDAADFELDEVLRVSSRSDLTSCRLEDS